MGTSAFGGFATGLLQGMEAADTHRRNKRVDALLSQKETSALNEDVGKYQDYLNEGGDPTNWEFQEPAEEPFLFRAFNTLKQKFGGAAPETHDPYAAARESYAAGKPQAIPSSVPAMADGGSIDEARMKRSYGEHYLTEEEARAKNEDYYARNAGMSGARPESGPYAPGRQAIPTSGGGVRAALGDIGRAATDYFDDTIAGAEEAGALQDLGNEGIRNAQGANETGRAIREGASMGLTGVAETTRGLVKDTVIDNPILGGAISGIAGFFGYGGTKNNRQPDPSTPAPQTPDADVKKEAIAGSTGTEEPAEGVAVKAIEKAVGETPGHPDNPDQAFDWGEVAGQGMTPEEIPHVGMKDWNEYRRRHVLAGIKQGRSVADSNAEVDQIQQNGMLSNMRQASYLLMAGDAKGSALAARAAYQYFPNGSDLKFSTMRGQDGKEVVIAAGVNEETGEPVGKPQVITPEYLNAMVANFSDPKAFNAWKGDKAEAVRLEQEFADKRVMQEQELRSAAVKDDYYKSGAELNRAKATSELSPRSSSASAGLKQADYDRAYAVFEESQELMAIKDPAIANFLTALMATRYQQQPGNYSATKNEVLTAYRNDTLQEFMAQHGIE